MFLGAGSERRNQHGLRSRANINGRRDEQLMGNRCEPILIVRCSRLRSSIAWGLIAASCTLNIAWADPPNDKDNFALAEIVVSASRIGDQSLQKTPMAISVISPQELDGKGLSGISDFLKNLPSVNMQSVSPGENDIEMRGLVVDEVDPTNAQERSLVA